MEQTLNGIPAEPERSYVWEAAEAIEQLQRARDEFHEDNEVLRLRCERLERELRLAESARDYANDMLDRAKSRANYTREIDQERMRLRAALERIAATDAEHPLALLMVWQIARETLAAPAPATPGPARTAEASHEASGGRELLSPEPVTGTPSEPPTLQDLIAARGRIDFEIEQRVCGSQTMGVQLFADPYIPPPGACPSPIGGKETEAECRAAGQCGCKSVNGKG